MKKIYLTLLTIILMQGLFAQRWKLYRYEVYGGVGTIHMFTDLGVSNKESLLNGFRIDFTRPSVTLGVKYKFSPFVLGKFHLAYGYGYSRDITNPRYIGGTGFKSSTHLIEQIIGIDYFFLPEERSYRSAAIYNRRGLINYYSIYAFYVTANIGWIYYNSNYDIVPRPYDKIKKSGFSITIPIGVGVRYNYSNKVLLGLETGPRFTLTDYLEGFTTKFSKFTDLYWLTTFTVSYRIKTTRRNLPAFLDRNPYGLAKPPKKLRR